MLAALRGRGPAPGRGAQAAGQVWELQTALALLSHFKQVLRSHNQEPDSHCRQVRGKRDGGQGPSGGRGRGLFLASCGSRPRQQGSHPDEPRRWRLHTEQGRPGLSPEDRAKQWTSGPEAHVSASGGRHVRRPLLQAAGPDDTLPPLGSRAVGTRRRSRARGGGGWLVSGHQPTQKAATGEWRRRRGGS